MRVSDLINLASEYLKLGIIVGIFIMFCIFAGYFLVYRKLLKGQRKIDWKIFLWWGIFLCYLSVVLGATLLSRSAFWSSKIQPLFYSYRDAWINFSNAAWRNIILNFCMFIPFGIWLPLGIKGFRKFWKTYLAGFAFTLFIECIQLLFRRGMFELDDILGNTVGTMIGYGLFAIGALIINIIKKRKSGNVISAAALQLPLIITVAAFTIIFVKYNTQELGNNPYRYIEAYDSNMISVKGESEFSTEERDINVYETVTLTVEEAKEKGEKIFETLGTTIDESRVDIYDETIFLYSDKGSYSLGIDYQGGTYRLTCFNVLFPEGGTISEPVSGADEETIRSAFNEMGFEIPKEAVFKELGSGNYQFEIAMSETEEGIINGTLGCSYYGEKGIGDISNGLITCTPYKTYPAISEQEAYDKIVNGEFQYYVNGRLEIQIESCSLVYGLDSKGYYQPNYQFECVVYGKVGKIMIPAIKN